MGVKRISTGSKELDNFLDGGFETDIITTLYGPGGSGKTCLCLICSIDVVRNGKKVIYIDTEGSFSLERLKQLAPDYKEILEDILFLKPTTFGEQKKAFKKLKELVNYRIGLIVVDTISMLYRIELGKSEEVYETNRELGLQISYLTEIARKKNIPILITNQVYSSFDDREKVKMVGGDILKYGSKCLIELQKKHKNRRIAILRKHRSIEEEKIFVFDIVEIGIVAVQS
jgi:DNA repair protein RadB